VSNPNDNNPAYGAHLQPFSGITTFMRRPASRDLADVDIAIVGIPFDSGTSFRSGARFGPRKIREMSLLAWGHNTFLDIAPADKINIIDYGDIDVIPVSIAGTMKNITTEVDAILEHDITVISLGGDHSIALPLLRAHATKFGSLAVVQFDAHPDTWESEYGEHRYSHGTPFRHAIEEGLIDTDAYIQIGIRCPLSNPDILKDARYLGAQVITIHDAFEMGIPAVISAIQKKVGDRPVYVSLDIDAADPAYAPGTGTPEVGGFSSYQMQQLVRGLLGLNFVGFDLVEVCPPYDHSDITAILGANLVFEFLAILAKSK
jgi:agmatinase/guanidinopropionase